jgi:hypothetical protein
MGGFHGHGGTPSSLDGLFHGNPIKMDDEMGYHISGNLHKSGQIVTTEPCSPEAWNHG